MSRKIYSRLFKFANIKSWKKSGDDYSSSFYNEYVLDFKCKDLWWEYNIRKSGYSSSPLHTGIVTLNMGGKTVFTLCLSVILFAIVATLGYNYKFYISSIFLSYILSFFALSIFNWSIYLTFKKVLYNIENAKEIRKKEEEEFLRQELVRVVNRTMANDPKFARRTKLKQLNKIPFWKKWKKVEEDEKDI